jgi:hypothetical protein
VVFKLPSRFIEPWVTSVLVGIRVEIAGCIEEAEGWRLRLDFLVFGGRRPAVCRPPVSNLRGERARMFRVTRITLSLKIADHPTVAAEALSPATLGE